MPDQINISIINKTGDRFFLKKWDPPNHSGKWLEGVDGSAVSPEDSANGWVKSAGELLYTVGSLSSDRKFKVSWDMNGEGEYEDDGADIKCDHYFLSHNEVLYFVLYKGSSAPPRAEHKRKKRRWDGSHHVKDGEGFNYEDFGYDFKFFESY
ncbi:hypothetical protein H072_4872 [Dactylellina haptotyla CBS 200.50]|uniref:Uncharacterized protein n=1 Tax=Dactylellina haptotyla (strain CBS 200.50) TaxID=1284197 RepID=S8AEE1_DACHA|nr:hypothetical protein H072_4872 [Dactylellina haptotyla CBS 200.50]